MHYRLAAVAGLLVAAAQPAWATEVSRSTLIAAPPDKVWSLVAPFCGVAQWHPAVETCELRMVDGKQERHLGLKGGGTIDERLLNSSAARRRVVYTILAAPLPVKDYVSTMTLSETRGGTRLVWKSTFTPSGATESEAAEVVGGIYTSGFEGLKAKLTQK